MHKGFSQKLLFVVVACFAITVLTSCVSSRPKVETKASVKKLLPPAPGYTTGGTSNGYSTGVTGSATGYSTGYSTGYATGGTTAYTTAGSTTGVTTTGGTTTGGSSTGSSTTGGNSGSSSGGNSGGNSGGKTNGGTTGSSTGKPTPSTAPRKPEPTPDSGGSYQTNDLSSKEDLKNLPGSAYGENGGVWGPTKGSPDQRQLQVGDHTFMTEKVDPKTGKGTGVTQFWDFQPNANGGKWTPISAEQAQKINGGKNFPTIRDAEGKERVVSPTDPGLPFMLQQAMKPGADGRAGMSEGEARQKFGHTVVDEQMEQIRKENPTAWEWIKSNSATGTDPYASPAPHASTYSHPDEGMFDDIPNSGDFGSEGYNDYEYGEY